MGPKPGAAAAAERQKRVILMPHTQGGAKTVLTGVPGVSGACLGPRTADGHP